LRKEIDETKENLWDHRNDEDFEEKSQWIIDRAIRKMKDDTQKEFLKFLYQLKRDRKPTEPKNEDKQLLLAKELLNSVKEEELHIFQVVHEHVVEMILELESEERVDDYLKLRERIAHERVDNYQRKVKMKKEDTDTEIDPETQQKKGERVVYVHPTKKEYHTNQGCDYLTYLDHEERKPCKICLEQTEDVLNSSIGSKVLGFVSDKTQYHDEDCLVWMSEKGKDKELRTVCLLCQETEDIEKALERSRGNRSTGSRIQR
jgi:hypothetical protein